MTSVAAFKVVAAVLICEGEEAFGDVAPPCH
jgi:hypothetical protein